MSSDTCRTITVHDKNNAHHISALFGRAHLFGSFRAAPGAAFVRRGVSTVVFFALKPLYFAPLTRP